VYAEAEAVLAVKPVEVPTPIALPVLAAPDTLKVSSPFPGVGISVNFASVPSPAGKVRR
jgi:hypothetical protein